MSVPEHITACRFKVGEHGVANPVDLLWQQASKEVCAVASSVKANKAICNRCKYVIYRDELFSQDLKKLACPNCYSSNLSVIEVRFELGWNYPDARGANGT